MISVKQFSLKDQKIWDQYVENHSKGTLYHLSGWKNVIEKTYGHKTYYLIAFRYLKDKARDFNKIECDRVCEKSIVGILPLVHMKHFLFGNKLVSIPFFDMGGILAQDKDVENALLLEAITLGKKLKADNIELRHTQPLLCIESKRLKDLANKSAIQTKSHKVRMLLEVADSSEAMWKSFKSKHRNKIKIPVKKGFEVKIGDISLISDFYNVFCVNMRDLGSPVHSKGLFINVLQEFSEKAKIVMIYKGKCPVSCGIFIGFNKTLENPWSSFLREYSRERPNYLLYWAMLEYASDNGYHFFDFGRSSPDEGTFKFKIQWGAQPEPLYWYYISLNNKPISKVSIEKSKFNNVISFWRKLPVPITKIIGPQVRKHISL
ncbi:MAG: FemAB family PEP-CTERM system-associated protein [Desulfobacteraceae bacterium]|nr:FemAB family PEP-CTERM system-associated protein [Desulfobacteraceae bacterium]